MRANLTELLTKDKKRRAKEEETDMPNYAPVSFPVYSGHSHAASWNNNTWTYGSGIMTTDNVNYITSSTFVPSFNLNLTDYVFGEKDVLPIDVVMKRIERYKKKHPEEFTKPLEQMYEKAYPKRKASGIFGLFKKEAK